MRGRLGAARWVGCAALLLAIAAPAAAQGTRVTAAVPSSLGAIPNGTGMRDVQFAVPGSGLVRSVTVSVTMTHGRVADLAVALVGPDGTQVEVFSWAVAPGSSMAGTYTFTDGASQSFYDAARSAGNGAVPPGAYLPNNGSGGVQSFGATYNDRPGGGLWVLRVRDNFGLNAAGSITAATLTLGLTAGANVDATPGSLGAIPDAVGGPYKPGPPRDVTFTVPSAGPVTNVRVSLAITHPFVGDLVATLIAPSGRQHVLFGYTGASASVNAGSNSDLNGRYRFTDAATGPTWWSAASAALLPPGDYLTTTIGPSPGGGQATSLNAAFTAVDSAGVWTVRVTDGYSTFFGTVSGASLVLTTAPLPVSTNDAFVSSYLTTLSIPAPGVLGNDDDRLGGSMTATLSAPAANGTVSLAATGAFTYTPRAGFTGTDTFTYRATNANGPGTLATVTIMVPTPTTVQAPTEFRTSAMSGHQVTLRWTPPAGPVATDFIVEGGVAPGQPLAAIATGGPLPILTFHAPAGVFYLRVRAVANGQQSAPSNEIPLVVDTPAPPSAPADLTGVVNGGALGLSWRNTFAGAPPAAVRLVVTGSAVGATTLPLSDTFAFTGVPAGTYTFRVQAVNGAGVSADSNPVTLTFPAGCAGPPVPPANFLAYAVGNVVHLVWDPPTAGAAAATSYVLTVGGSFSASLPFAGRTLSTPAPPGAYTFAVASVNACGTGVPTPAQTVFVP